MNKSAVCRIGNRLTAQGEDRRTAFREAWRIVKAGSVELKVAGVTFGSRQEALRRLATYKAQDIHTVLVPENNPYDPKAIAIKVTVNGTRGIYCLGYIPREHTVIAAALRGRLPSLRLLDGDIRGARVTLAV